MNATGCGSGSVARRHAPARARRPPAGVGRHLGDICQTGHDCTWPWSEGPQVMRPRGRPDLISGTFAPCHRSACSPRWPLVPRLCGSLAGSAKHRVLGAPINRVSSADILDICHHEVAADSPAPIVIASQNMHGLHTYFVSPEFRDLHEHPRTVVHVDGTPLMWLARLKGYGFRYRHRTGCIVWVPELLTLAEREGWRIFYLGGTEDISAKGLAAIRSRWSSLTVDGRHGYFEMDGPENQAVLAQIAEFSPHIVFVGMGMGRQERWILRNLAAVEASVVVTTGSLLELLAGHRRTAPRVLGPLGLEWLFRLFDRPDAAHRYVVEPWQMLVHSFRFRHSKRRSESIAETTV